MKKVLLLSVSFFVLAVSFASLQLTSSTKANATVMDPNRIIADPIAGIWTGVYTTDQVRHTPESVTFILLPDGVFFKRCKVVGNTSEYSLSKGSWTLDGNVFQYTDTAVLYSGGTVINTGTATLRENGVLSDFRWKDLDVQTYTGDYLDVKKISSDIPASLPACTTSPNP